jgi:hypothetical protein
MRNIQIIAIQNNADTKMLDFVAFYFFAIHDFLLLTLGIIFTFCYHTLFYFRFTQDQVHIGRKVQSLLNMITVNSNRCNQLTAYYWLHCWICFIAEKWLQCNVLLLVGVIITWRYEKSNNTMDSTTVIRRESILTLGYD